MQKLGLAFRCFFAVLFGGVAVDRAERLLGSTLSDEATDTEPTKRQEPSAAAPTPAPPPAKSRSDALTLLAALQRESRFLDIVNEPLGDYSDEQVGAAARDVIRDASSVLQRMFDLQPVVAQEEGTSFEVPAGYDPATYRLSGSVVGEAPYEGSLVHHGWRANRCELPEWSGADEAAQVVAPAEIEVSAIS